MALALAAMLLVALAALATNWAVGKRVRAGITAQAAVLPAATQLRTSREMLELYTANAVATGNEAHAVRYGEVQPQLRASLGELRSAIRSPEGRSAIDRLEQAEHAISRIEYRALDLAVDDRRGAAEALLAGERYRALARDYGLALSRIREHALADLDATQEETGQFLSLNLLVNMLALLLMAFSWLLILRPARAWAQQLEEARRRAEEAAAAKSDFLAVMSHEMRTPLNSIIGFADLALRHSELKGSLRRNVELVHAAGNMLLTVINDLLDFSKMEAASIELDDRPLAIETLVDNALSIIRPAADLKGLELRIDVDPRLPPFLRGDENRLRQILLNLLNNAVKFTEAGSVALSIARLGEREGLQRLRFEVSDTGPGIDAEARARLFQPFVQVNSALTRAYGGTGLGLSISRRLVEAMGGEIGVESEPGRGSTFWFTLDLPAAEALQPQLPEAPSAEVRGASILLVEDLEINRQLALAMLGVSDHRVDTAENGEEALEAVQAKGYDLVLMDIQMPRMDGITATRLIRQLPPPACDVPVLAMTANVLPDQVAAFRRAGMDGHIPKPLTQRELDRAIAQVLAPGGVSGDGASAADDEEAEFDEAALSRLQAMLPPDQLRRHAEELAADSAALAAADPAGSGGRLRERAHKIVAAAGWLGLPRLSARALMLEQACRSGEGVDAALAALGEASGDVAAHVLPRLERQEG